VEHVRICRFCGHINPAEETARCNNCRSFSGLTTVPRAEGEQIARRKRLGYFRSRLIRFLLVLAPIIGLALWVSWDFLDLAPNPLGPTTNVGASVGSQTWAQARRTPENTGYTPDPAPFPHKVEWTFATSRPLVSSPAVVGDRVYLTTEDGRAVALDRQTGQLLWEYHSGFPSSSTPAVAGRSVLVAFRPGLIAALNRETGSVQWERNIKSPILASPIVVDGTMYVGAADGKLYAFDAAAGGLRWAFESSDWITSPVAYAEDTVIVMPQDSQVHVLDTNTGRNRLTYDTGRGRRSPGGPAIQGDLAYFGSFGGRVWAIDRHAKNYPLDRPILFLKANLFVWGILSTPPVQRGSVWATPVEGDVTQSPAVAHGRVYATTTEGKVIALNAATGAKEWTTNLGVEITAAPTVAGDTLLIGTEEGIVFGLDAHSGETLWEFQTGGKITGSPIVVGDTLYVVSHDGKLYAVSGKE